MHRSGCPNQAVNDLIAYQGARNIPGYPQVCSTPTKAIVAELVLWYVKCQQAQLWSQFNPTDMLSNKPGFARETTNAADQQAGTCSTRVADVIVTT